MSAYGMSPLLSWCPKVIHPFKRAVLSEKCHIESGIVRPSNNAQEVNLEISILRWLGIDLNDITSQEVTLRNALYFASDLLAHGNGINSKCTIVS